MAKKKTAETPTPRKRGRGRPPKPAPKRPRGRPPKGLKPGESVTGYKRLTLRLPPRTKTRLQAASRTLGVPAWLIIVDALDDYFPRKGC